MTTPVIQINKPALANRAMAAVRSWQAGQYTGLACPICEATDLVITDRSARPHMAWYVLKCASCGLDEAIGVPAGAHTGEHDA